MKKSFGWGGVFATLFLLALVALVMTLALAWTALPLDHTTITIDGETIALSGIEGWQAALLALAAVIAGMVGLIVAALAVVFALAAAVLGFVIAIVAVLGSLALVASPLVFIGWLIWLLVRPTRSAAAAVA